MARQGCSKLLPSRHIPKPDRLVITTRDEHLAGRTEHHAPDEGRVRYERRGKTLTVHRIPHGNRAVVTSRSDHASIWAEGDTEHPIIATGLAVELPGRDVPQDE